MHPWLTSLIQKHLFFMDYISQKVCIMLSFVDYLLHTSAEGWDDLRLVTGIVFLLVSDKRSYKIQRHLLTNNNQQLLHKQGFC